MVNNKKYSIHIKKNLGFTLIELLVVVAIMAIIAGISSDLFVSILKGANKANVMNEIKQNGNYVLEIMERNIRNAKSVTQSVNGQTIIIETSTGQYIRFTIHSPETMSNPKINGYISMATSINGIDYSAEKPLTNTDRVSGASVQSGSFTVVSPVPPNQNPQYVSISFKILQAENAPSRQDYKIGGDGLVFQTTISLRTY